MDSYSFNNAEELNKIYYDRQTETFLYRQDKLLCCVARLTPRKDRVYPEGNQNIFRLKIHRSEDGFLYYRDNPRSTRMYPLWNMEEITKHAQLHIYLTESMITDRAVWIARILDAKKKMEKRAQAPAAQ